MEVFFAYGPWLLLSRQRYSSAKEYEIDIIEAWHRHAACCSVPRAAPCSWKSLQLLQELEELMGKKIADRENLKPDEKALRDQFRVRFYLSGSEAFPWQVRASLYLERRKVDESCKFVL
eukprot:Skav204247  [mRNA]  locus=scaffold2414:26778:27134:- [translate_table: standard]